ncbi:hypothetical protein ACSBR2_006521 [Camellia fascicularis]
MEGGTIFKNCNMTVILENKSPHSSSELLESLWISNSSPSFHENCNEDFDGCLYQPEKKRRLTTDQVRCLERNFEVENKLEPERKAQIANELGLQPRQVTIWFQNRRARFRTKQLEKDHDSLKASYDGLKAGYDILLKEKERLRNEVHLLTDKLLLTEKENPITEPTDFNNEMATDTHKQITNATCESITEVPMEASKQEDASSAKSDVFDSESHSSLLEPADSAHAFRSDQSDFSRNDEDELTRTLLPPVCFPKLEDGDYNEQSPTNCCNWSFPVEDQPCWLWPC